jgi:hypothetical protein
LKAFELDIIPAEDIPVVDSTAVDFNVPVTVMPVVEVSNFFELS